MIFPITNPVRFTNQSIIPDFQSIFPNVSNEQIGTEYYEAFKTMPYIREHAFGKYLRFQVDFSDTNEVDNFKLYRNGELWSNSISEKIKSTNFYEYYTILASEGIYYLQSVASEETYTSDFIIVRKNNNRLVKIEAYETNGNSRAIRFNTNFNGYNVIGYYCGWVEPKIGTTYIDQYKGDPNTIVNVEIEPSMDWTINLEVHKVYIKHILYLFSLNNIKVNDKIITLKGEIKNTRIADTDMYNITIEAQTEMTYNYD